MHPRGPRALRRAIDAGKALLIVELRKRRNAASSHRTQRGRLGVDGQPRAGASGNVQAERPGADRAGVRYEHEAPGDLLHIDTKKLGRIVRPSHRVTGNRRDSVEGAGWETLFVAIDDHARLAFTAMHPDEKQAQAVASCAMPWPTTPSLGVTVKAAADRQRLGVPLTRVQGNLHANWASSTASRGPTGHRPTARPSGSSSPHCASGPTAGPIRTQPIEPMPWQVGSTITTAIARTAALAASHLCPDSTRQETTS
jgi:hypothetical protein